MKSTITAIICLCTWYNLCASTWYVAPNGNDNNAGTLAQPFKTIPRAIEAASPGDVIELRNGTYVSAEIRITKSQLTLRSYPGEWAIINAPVNNEDIASCIWYSEPEVNGGLLERLEITGGYYYGVSFETNWDWGLPASQVRGAGNITIRQCRIHHTGRDCIKIKPACNNIQIISCELYNSGIGPANTVANGGPNAEGIDNVNGDGMVVRNCYIHNISTTGVYIKGGVKDCFIEENLIHNVSEAGILMGFYTDAEFFDQDGTNPAFYECQYSLARNNIVYNTGGAGIGFFAARNCSAYNNTVVTGSGDFHAPLYLSPGEIWINDNVTLTPPNFNLLVVNNLFIDQSGTGDEDYTVQIREGALSGVNTIDYNIYQKTTGQAAFDDGVSWPALSFAQWKTQLGFDAHSLEAYPALDANLHLTPNSPAIDAGQNSPATRDYDAQPRAGAVDIGADEYNNGPALQIPPAGGVIGTGAGNTSTAVYDWTSTIDASVFPNPATRQIQVQCNCSGTVQLLLFDRAGVLQKQQAGTIIQVDGLPAGLYQLTVRTDEGCKTIPVMLF